MLEFERQWWKFAGSKEEAIRQQFDMSGTRYFQILNDLIDRPEALAYAGHSLGEIAALAAAPAASPQKSSKQAGGKPGRRSRSASGPPAGQEVTRRARPPSSSSPGVLGRPRDGVQRVLLAGVLDRLGRGAEEARDGGGLLGAQLLGGRQDPPVHRA